MSDSKALLWSSKWTSPSALLIANIAKPVYISQREKEVAIIVCLMGGGGGG
jgi:hypothetical protein